MGKQFGHLAPYGIEVVGRTIRRGMVEAGVFDFDGTISFLRAGWQQVMGEMMVRTLTEIERWESEEQVAAAVEEVIERTAGEPTISQMGELRRLVAERGAPARSAEDYKAEYLDAFGVRVRERMHLVDSGPASVEDYLVPGAVGALRWLQARGIPMYIASSTDQTDVEREAGFLGVATYFKAMYGSVADPNAHSKARVIKMVMERHGLHGPELVGFGDGYVEIQNVADVGGIPIGVATDEARPGGLDAWKRNRLIVAGADVIIPDFREHERLLAWLFAEE